MRTGKWPEWTDNIPSIQRWRRIERPTVTIVSSADALKAWAHHYAASATEKQIENHTDHMEMLAAVHDLLTLTPVQASTFFQRLGTQLLPRHYSGIVARIMRDRLLSRPQIINALQEGGIEVDIRKLSAALANRNLFELVAKPGRHRTGKYRAARKNAFLSASTRNKYLQT